MRVRSLFFTGILLGAFVPVALGAPVFGEIVVGEQPDGTAVKVRVWGDEYYRVMETLDGYTAVRDPQSGYLCYAELSADGKRFVSSGVPVNALSKSMNTLPRHLRMDNEAVRALVAPLRRADATARAKKSAAPAYRGTAHGLTLLVEFPDDPQTIASSEVGSFCNTPGYAGFGNNGSVRDYYYDVSDGQLTYTNVVTEYYMAQHPKSYYADESVGYTVRARALITEALDDLASKGFDFSQCDGNADGEGDALNCFYAGACVNQWSYGLWPHSSGCNYTYGGIHFGSYQITNMGFSLTLGTFCHENGHMLCDWPDLYDYDYDSYGAGRFCLMAHGGHGTNPVEPCCYLKERCGWTNTIELAQLLLTPCTVTAAVNTCYKFVNAANSRESYMVEVRYQDDRDQGVPGSGLVIWHIDRNGSNDWNEMLPDHHFEATVVQADNEWDLENDRNSGQRADMWPTPVLTACTAESEPNTGWWDGSYSYLQIKNMSAAGPVMTFDMQGPGAGNEDADGDGLSDYDETRDLDPVAPGIQNPFDPMDADSTGNNESMHPDGIDDGDNDFDNDGLSNADEFAYGTSPIDNASGMPAATALGLALLAVGLVAGARKRMPR